MITPDEALSKILAKSCTLGRASMDIRKACGMVLARDVKAVDCLPRFDNSAMDGFAVHAADVRGATKRNPVVLRLVGEAQAGLKFRKKIPRGCAIRISTGALVPGDVNAVVMQEECEVRGKSVVVLGSEPKGGNVRFRGEEIRKGQIAMRRGNRLSPGAIAWLATMGIRNVFVFCRPRVGLLRSGSEIVEFGKHPRPEQVRDAHGISLSSALREMGIDLKITPLVRDNSAAIRRAFSKLTASCDVVITTGGVSVGRHDLFHEVARAIGIRRIFHKVAQKPGKPIAFGTKSRRLWFGLPGNPVSSLFCFYHYVRPAILKMSGREDYRPVWFGALASTSVRRNPNRTEFMRGKMRDGRVTFAVKQGSHCLGSFADSDVLVRVDSSCAGRRVLCMRV